MDINYSSTKTKIWSAISWQKQKDQLTVQVNLDQYLILAALEIVVTVHLLFIFGGDGDGGMGKGAGLGGVISCRMQIN